MNCTVGLNQTGEIKVYRNGQLILSCTLSKKRDWTKKLTTWFKEESENMISQLVTNTFTLYSWYKLLIGEYNLEWYKADCRLIFPADTLAWKEKIPNLETYKVPDFGGHCYMFLNAIIKPGELGSIYAEVNGKEVFNIKRNRNLPIDITILHNYKQVDKD
jgi:hypothetical protein